jgi:hypothetical protein
MEDHILLNGKTIDMMCQAQSTMEKKKKIYQNIK